MSDRRIVRAALVQATWTGDKESMIEKHIDYARKAAADGAQIMCFQELFYGPYFCQVQEPEFFAYTEEIPDGPTTKRSSRFNAERLVENEALELIYEMARFDEVLRDTYVQLEPCHLIVYLFKLCKAVTHAYKNLSVKDQDENVARARLALFATAKTVVADSMKVLGIEPLNKM